MSIIDSNILSEQLGPIKLAETELKHLLIAEIAHFIDTFEESLSPYKISTLHEGKY